MFRPLIYPFLIFRDFTSSFLVLGLIVVPCWSVFRLYRLRTTGHLFPFHRAFYREVLFLTAVLYLCGLAAVTLTPNHNSGWRADAATGIDLHLNLASLTCPSVGPPGDRAGCMRNSAGNVVLFFPLGILIALVWRRLRFWNGVQIAIALSVTIEVIQYISRVWGSQRSADINDIILNVLGACLGLALVSLLRLGRGARPVVPSA